jgi:hypothetical protein
MTTNYLIKKTMTTTKKDGLKKTHVLLTDSQSEVLELKTLDEAKNLITILNENSDSGWLYDIIEITKNV